MRGTSVGILCLVVLAGCVTTYHIDIDGHQLHRKSRELRLRGKAVVDATKESSSIDRSRPYAEPVTIDQTVTDLRGRTRYVRDLLRGCADDDFSPAANVDCELDQPMAYYRTRTWETRSTTRFLQWTLGAAIAGTLGGALACHAFCPEDSTVQDVSTVTIYATGAAFLGIVIWAIVDCAGKWGQPGCRD